MKKILPIIVFFIATLSIAAIFMSSANSAKAAYPDKCIVSEPDEVDGDLLTRRCWFYNEDGQKIIDPAEGYAGRVEVYEHLLEEEGRYELVEAMYLDPEGNLMLRPDGYARMTTDYVLHEDGPVCRWWYTPGESLNDICGYTQRYYDTEGNPVIYTGGDNGIRYIDKKVQGTYWFVVGGAPVGSGYAAFSVSMSRTDDPESEYVERSTFYGTDDKPMLLDGIYATFEMRITKKTEERCHYGTDGELADTPLGYACSIHTYTDDDSESFMRYYNANRLPTTDAEWGVHAIHYYYGSIHRQVPRTEYLDVNDQLTNNSKGYAVVVKEYEEYIPPSYDSPGSGLTSFYPLSTVYYDKDGNTVEISK